MEPASDPIKKWVCLFLSLSMAINFIGFWEILSLVHLGLLLFLLHLCFPFEPGCLCFSAFFRLLCWVSTERCGVSLCVLHSLWGFHCLKFLYCCHVWGFPLLTTHYLKGEYCSIQRVERCLTLFSWLVIAFLCLCLGMSHVVGKETSCVTSLLFQLFFPLYSRV